MKPDLVYILKDQEVNEEFRYSLRSVEKHAKNFGKVVTIGGIVKGITPDLAVLLRQTGGTKYDKVNMTFREICLNPDISENFVLMNDDFFIMQDVDMSKLKTYYRCSMAEYLQIIVDACCPGIYTERLAKAAMALEMMKLATRCYEEHMPMLFNKHKLLEVIGAFYGFCGTRSLYGNYHKIKATKAPDCKVFTKDDDFVKDTTYLSTTDTSFRLGRVGEYIRDQFKDKSRYENV